MVDGGFLLLSFHLGGRNVTGFRFKPRGRRVTGLSFQPGARNVAGIRFQLGGRGFTCNIVLAVRDQIQSVLQGTNH